MRELVFYCWLKKDWLEAVVRYVDDSEKEEVMIDPNFFEIPTELNVL